MKSRLIQTVGMGLVVGAASLTGIQSPVSAAPAASASSGAPTITLGQDATTQNLQFKDCQDKFMGGSVVVGRGSVGQCVRIVQIWLGALDTAHAEGFDIPTLQVDGVYGPKTASAVAEFQKVTKGDSGPVDGVVGKLTTAEMLKLAQ